MKKATRYVMILFALSLCMPGFSIQVKSGTAISTSTIHPSTPSDRLGAFLIICGDRGDHEFNDKIVYGGNSVYDTMRSLGFPASRIYSLGPSSLTLTHQNATTTLANIQYAIETWAASYVSSTRGLGIYMFDHGGSGFMCLGGVSGSGGDLTASNFDTYLDNLQAAKSVSRVFLIYEACESGSFISQVSATDRIICTATNDVLGSSRNPADNWATFSEGFWGSIATGNSIGNAFIDACYYVVDTGHAATQVPWVDDNHDGAGHNLNSYATLPSGGDGSDALTTKFVYGATYSVGTMFKVRAMVNPHFIKNTDPIKIWATFLNGSKIKSVKARILPPGWQPRPPIQDNEGMVPQSDIGVLNVTLTNAGNGNFTGLYTPAGAPWPDGKYRINLMAFGDNGLLATQSVNISANVNGVPDADTTAPTVRIDTPFDGAPVSNTIYINASANDDQGLASLAISVDGKVEKNVTGSDLTYPYSASIPYDTKNSSHTITATATDLAGHTSIMTITVNPTDNTTLITWIIIIACGAGVLVVAIVLERVHKNKKARGSK
jgi:hypothetical protein